jgi:hypothetical protein
MELKRNKPSLDKHKGSYYKFSLLKGGDPWNEPYCG